MNNDFTELINKIADTKPAVKIILTPSETNNDGTVKVIYTSCLIRNIPMLNIEHRFQKKAIHKNIDYSLLYESINSFAFKNINIELDKYLYQITYSKGGDIKVIKHNRIKAGLPVIKIPTEHDRVKNYIIQDGIPLPFLVNLGVMEASGRVVNPMRRKFVQINKFLEVIDDIYEKLPATGILRIVDFGCGKSYLTFAMYHYFTQIRKREVSMTGLDLKQDVIEYCNKLSNDFGFSSLHFDNGNIYDCKSTNNAHLVVTLHACDTATDAALEKAVLEHVPVILSVPCCQHELFGQISSSDLKPIMKHGLLKERFSALLTDALRAEVLDLLGYNVKMVEFAELDDTPKNIMIKAVLTNSLTESTTKTAIWQKKYEEYENSLDKFNIHPSIDVLLKKYMDIIGVKM